MKSSTNKKGIKRVAKRKQTKRKTNTQYLFTHGHPSGPTHVSVPSEQPLLDPLPQTFPTASKSISHLASAI